MTNATVATFKRDVWSTLNICKWSTSESVASSSGVYLKVKLTGVGAMCQKLVGEIVFPCSSGPSQSSLLHENLQEELLEIEGLEQPALRLSRGKHNLSSYSSCVELQAAA